MPKYYVETGSLQDIVSASSPFNACLGAIRRASDRYLLETGEENLTLGESFIVNERGFPSSREPFTLDTVNDTMLATVRIIEAYENEN
jgi:hypothetical protein